MYTWAGMEKINFETARRYFCYSKVTVYLLYDDGGEAESETERDLEEHEAKGGEFGIEIKGKE